jgi:RNA polymerase sigma-70 factor (ECF subfamily)
MNMTPQMIRQYGPMVWRTVFRVVGGGAQWKGPAAEVEDCFQEVFLAALEIGRRETVHNWEGLLRRIGTARALDVLRRRVRERGRSDREADLEGIIGVVPPPDAAMEREELAGQLRRALVRLPADQAEMFCLRHVEGMSFEDIGGQFGITANAAGVVVHRAKVRLREIMGVQACAARDEVRHEQ